MSFWDSHIRPQKLKNTVSETEIAAVNALVRHNTRKINSQVKTLWFETAVPPAFHFWLSPQQKLPNQTVCHGYFSLLKHKNDCDESLTRKILQKEVTREKARGYPHILYTFPKNSLWLLTITTKSLHGDFHLGILIAEVNLTGHLTGIVSIYIQLLHAVTAFHGAVPLLILVICLLFLLWQIQPLNKRKVFRELLTAQLWNTGLLSNIVKIQ